jgi:hypothetical protein
MKKWLKYLVKHFTHFKFNYNNMSCLGAKSLNGIKFHIHIMCNFCERVMGWNDGDIPWASHFKLFLLRFVGPHMKS